MSQYEKNVAGTGTDYVNKLWISMFTSEACDKWKATVKLLCGAVNLSCRSRGYLTREWMSGSTYCQFFMHAWPVFIDVN